MKNKILSFILTVCFVLPCACFLFACDQKQTETYTVTFSVEGEVVDSKSVLSGQKVDCTEIVPTKVGYDFDGWYLDDFKWGFQYVPVTSDITLEACFIIKSYMVTFKYENGLEDRESIYKYGEKVKLPQEPTKENSVFEGWFKDGIKWNFNTDTVSEDMVLQVSWGPSRVWVTFDPDNGNQATMFGIAYGGKITSYIANPTKEGYNFAGWYYNDQPWDRNTIVYRDMIVVAHWTPKSVG